MRKVSPGQSLSVKVGEPFRLTYRDRSVSGYDTHIDLPDAFEELDCLSSPAPTFGGSTEVSGKLVCHRAGDYDIEVRTGRRWESRKSIETVHIRCGPNRRTGG